MKKILGLATLASVGATQLMAGSPVTYGVSWTIDVPEVGTTGSVAALAAVTAVGVLAWERRRRNK